MLLSVVCGPRTLYFKSPIDKEHMPEYKPTASLLTVFQMRGFCVVAGAGGVTLSLVVVAAAALCK